ncbi:MAG: hypothetical protein ACYCW6_30860 [Candidatus Xenobia bacterium]
MTTLIRGMVNACGLDSISQYHAIRHALVTGQDLARTLGVDARIVERRVNAVVVQQNGQRHTFEVERRPMRSAQGHVLYPLREQDILIHECAGQRWEFVLATGQPYPKSVS